MTDSTVWKLVDLARPRRTTREVRDHARMWLDTRGPLAALDDEALLHAFETSALTRPPASSRVGLLDVELTELYLRLCHRWLDITMVTGDPRFANAALKILSVCLLLQPKSLQVDNVINESVAVIEVLATPPTAAWAVGSDPPVNATPTETGLPALTGLARMAVLAGKSSRGLELFMAACRDRGVPISGVLCHQPNPHEPDPQNYYASAWYPRAAMGEPTASPTGGHAAVSIGHRDWRAAASQLAAWRTDLLVLIGMDVVPESVLEVPHVATINAHNGALPAYRGMDAVGWALLAGDLPTCTVHLVTRDVDAGDILCERVVPTNIDNLRHAVKVTQIDLLVSACATASVTGVLPPRRRQIGTPRRYYRMCPAIREILDRRYSYPEGKHA